MWTVYLKWQTTVTAFDLSGFSWVSAFRASLRSNWVNFSTKRAYIVVCGYEFSAVFARVFVSWHFHASPFVHFSLSSKLSVLKANKLATLLFHCSGDECITLPMNRLLSILSEGILAMANRYWTYLVLSNWFSERKIGSLRKFTSIIEWLMFLIKFSSSMIKS